MKEKPLYFESQGQRIFGVLHRADTDTPGGVFVLCSPFGEEKLWTHRVFVNMSRELAKRGYSSLRFDYMGHGDSEGLFHEADVESRMANIDSAIKYVQDALGEDIPVSLLGMRLGGTLASLVAEHRSDLHSLALWEPLVDGPAYMKELFRINLSTQTAVYRKIRWDTVALIDELRKGHTVNVDGYEIAWPFYEQVIGIDLLQEKKAFLGRVLVVNISRTTGRVNAKLAGMAETYRQSSFVHVQEEPFWKEIKEYYCKADNLYHETLKWIENNGK